MNYKYIPTYNDIPNLFKSSYERTANRIQLMADWKCDCCQIIKGMHGFKCSCCGIETQIGKYIILPYDNLIHNDQWQWKGHELYLCVDCMGKIMEEMIYFYARERKRGWAVPAGFERIFKRDFSQFGHLNFFTKFNSTGFPDPELDQKSS